MSILIKGMEMPKEGFVEILIRDDGTVQQTGQSYRIDGTDYYTPYIGEMPVMYEAVPVSKHGDLIDINALKLAIVNVDYVNKHDYLKGVLNAINNAPIVILTDKDGES